MRRIGLAVVLALSVVLAPLTDEAQQAGKVYRIAFLATASGQSQASQVDTLRAGLHDLGTAGVGPLNKHHVTYHTVRSSPPILHATSSVSCRTCFWTGQL